MVGSHGADVEYGWNPASAKLTQQQRYALPKEVLDRLVAEGERELEAARQAEERNKGRDDARQELIEWLGTPEKPHARRLALAPPPRPFHSHLLELPSVHTVCSHPRFALCSHLLFTCRAWFMRREKVTSGLCLPPKEFRNIKVLLSPAEWEQYIGAEFNDGKWGSFIGCPHRN